MELILLHFDVIEAFHGGLDGLKGMEHVGASLIGRRGIGIVHEAGHGLQEGRGPLLQAGHLLFPCELLFGAVEQIGQIGDVLAGRISVFMLFIHSFQLGSEGGDGLLASVDVFYEVIKLEQNFLLLLSRFVCQFELFAG